MDYSTSMCSKINSLWIFEVLYAATDSIYFEYFVFIQYYNRLW